MRGREEPRGAEPCSNFTEQLSSLENRESNRCSGRCIVEGIRVRDTQKNLPCCVHAFVCVCECDSGEQLSAGRCTQRGAIRHGGVTHIKDTHTHSHPRALTRMRMHTNTHHETFLFGCQCAMITIKAGFFSVGFGMAIVT